MHFARYTINAVYAPKNGEQRAMLIRVNGIGEYAESVTTDFKALMTGIYRIELEVKLVPKK
ncbi:hypothetical protein D3C86_2140500 [compost metagenome]